MTSITVITTFHQPGMTAYGQRFIESFVNNVDKQINLIVYAEDCTPLNPDPSQVTILDQAASLPKLIKFKQKWKGVPKANGTPTAEIQARRPRDRHKAFKWDAVRFSNKVYAVLHACGTVDTDWVVWIDADSYIHSKWSYNNFAKLLPADKYITYVGRGKGSQTWPECGFYGVNLNHQITAEFLRDFEEMYENAEQGIFQLDEWHDSYVFGEILKKYQHHNAQLDYSAQLYMKQTATGGGGHPLINTQLGQYMDHLKGDRKIQGKSKKSDMLVNRTEDYWRT